MPGGVRAFKAFDGRDSWLTPTSKIESASIGCVYCRRFRRQILWIRKILQDESNRAFVKEAVEIHLLEDAKVRIKRVLKEKTDANTQS